MTGETILHLDRSNIRDFIKPPARSIHKGDRGGVLVVGGSWNYRGAPMLAALGALRAGAGFVVLAIPDFMVDAASVFIPEAVFLPLRTANDEIRPEYIADAIAPWAASCESAVFGPGMGRGAGVRELTKYFWTNWNKPLLLDADALYFFAQTQGELPPRANAAITPHSGEAARILGMDAAQVNADRIGAAKRLAEKAGTALLKGQHTVVACGGNCRIINEGSPALAVPGSGDVLSGVIGALLASGLDAFDAAAAGALLHACAGTNIEKKSGVNGALAREIADEIPHVFK